MMEKKVAISLVFLLLFALPSYTTQAEDAETVDAFGDGFVEMVVADASDDLDEPTDMEFHPGRANELWIAKRATDSITIVHNTGLDNQTSENREDAYSNHFKRSVPLPSALTILSLTGSGARLKRQPTRTAARQRRTISWDPRFGLLPRSLRRREPGQQPAR